MSNPLADIHLLGGPAERATMDLHGARNCQKVVDCPHERSADNGGTSSDGTPGLTDTHRLSTQKTIRAEKAIVGRHVGRYDVGAIVGRPPERSLRRRARAEGAIPPGDGLRPVRPMAHHSNVGGRNPRHTLGHERCMAFARPSYRMSCIGTI
jgi:hypothetical protein